MRIRTGLIIFSLLAGTTAWGQEKEKPDVPKAGDNLLNLMKDEMNREMAVLKTRDIPAYYIDYRISAVKSSVLQASFGSMTGMNDNNVRVFSANVKVGSYELDNTHHESGMDTPEMPRFAGINLLPIDDDATVIKKEMWQSTQQAYRSAMESFKAIRTALSSKPKKEKLADFTKEKASVYYEEQSADMSTQWSRAEWESKVKKYSGLFAPAADFISAEATFRIESERKYFVSTEGSEIVQNLNYCYLFISGSVRADDGDILPLTKSYYAPSPSAMPSDDVIAKDIAELMRKLRLLKKAPLAEPYTGPAILYAQTAGVFFHEIFGHRVEGHRLRSEFDGQTFKEKINEQVLPKSLDVIFDPTISKYEGKLLNGFYQYDDEGVKSQRVKSVEKGVLKNFLMSRTPLENFATSNGHGRSSLGMNPVSRQSNLIVENSKPMSEEELRKLLIKECVKQGKKYGYFFKDVIGGFTTTDRFNPNAFNIFPTEVYRVYVDGRADELVRGVDLIGTPLSMFAEISAAGDTKDVFIGFCGAESGSVPVSAVAPSLFVRRIETQKKPKENQEPTLLPSPDKKN
jgi:TldD protein